jgi:hypothetical protein
LSSPLHEGSDSPAGVVLTMEHTDGLPAHATDDPE